MPSEYLLGSSDTEILRMRFQHDVWKGPTDAFLDRIGVKNGWRCLDVGAGPGFTTADLRQRVGADGSVTAVEPSPLFGEHLMATIGKNGWTNVKVVRSTVEEADLKSESYDLVFARWVLNFVPEREAFLAKLAQLTKKNGISASTMPRRQAVKAVFIGWAPAMPAATKACSATGGVRPP